AEPWELPPQFGSDHQPFVEAGVSSLFLHRFEDPNYHTPNDTSQAVDPGLLGEALALGHAFVAEVLTEAPVLASR
ncbi:MAG: M28 family peptidase, partial [Armatimonadota bacterium]